MNIPMENCGSCTGETRVACDALYAGMRQKFSDMIPGVFEDDSDGLDLIGEMELTQEMMAFGEQNRLAFDAIGCELAPEKRLARGLMELMTGVELGIADYEEEQERQRTERLEDLLALSDAALQDGRALLARVQDETANAISQATQDYCAEQGWDPDNLSFVEKLDVDTHLRNLNLLKR